MPEQTTVLVEDAPKDDSQEKVDVTPPVTSSAEDQLAAKIKADYEALYGSRLKELETKLQNQLSGARRIEQEKGRLQEEVNQLKAKTAASATPSADPWSSIQDGTVWKAEIERVAEQKAEEKLRAWQAQQFQQSQVQQYQNVLSASKQRVVSKYPDLHPETGTEDSAVAKAYQAVLTEHPDYLSNPYGPELAMYQMEEQLKSNANTNAPRKGQGISGLPPSRAATPDGRVTLTREQKAFCDRHQIKYEDYLKTATALEHGVVET